MKLHQAMRSRSFALLWLGQTCSRLGDFVYQIALMWWVVKKTSSATAMGGVMVFGFIPTLIFLLIGGAAVDRYDRVKAMLISDAGRFVVAAALAVLSATDRLTLIEVYAASFLFGLADAFFTPAYASVIPSLVPAEHLPSANSMTSLSQQFGRIAGPPLGAFLVAAGGLSTAFALNAVSFLAAGGCVIPLLWKKSELVAAAIDAEAAPTVQSPAGKLLLDVRDGIRFVLATPWLWRCIVIFTAGNLLLAGPYAVGLPFLLKNRPGGLDVKQLAWLYAMFPVGYAIAAVTLGSKSRLPRRGMAIAMGLCVAGAMIALFGWVNSAVVLSAAAIANGFALEVAGLAWAHLMQERVPSNMLGRVSSVDALGSFSLLPVAYAMTGWACDHWQPAAVFRLAGLATVITGGLALTQRSLRDIDRHGDR